MPADNLVLLLTALAVLNLVTFLTFWHDKQRAVQGGRRVRESNLLMLALLGGSAGVLAARQMFRHKTRKQPFATLLMLIAVIQVGGLIDYFLL